MFRGAQVVDLAKSKVSSVITLRDVVRIPPPSTPVLVKVFDRSSLPDVLKPAFKRPGVMGVTINGRYIAILHQEINEEYTDILAHELVHAYISLASPKPLPLWFQEASAVHFSTGKEYKLYTKALKDEPGMVLNQHIELPNDYKQRLHSLEYLIAKAGEKRFMEWYRHAVETGDVDARPLLGLKDKPDTASQQSRHEGVFLLVTAAVAVGVIIGAYYSWKRGGDYY